MLHYDAPVAGNHVAIVRGVLKIQVKASAEQVFRAQKTLRCTDTVKDEYKEKPCACL